MQNLLHNFYNFLAKRTKSWCRRGNVGNLVNQWYENVDLQSRTEMFPQKREIRITALEPAYHQFSFHFPTGILAVKVAITGILPHNYSYYCLGEFTEFEFVIFVLPCNWKA